MFIETSIQCISAGWGHLKEEVDMFTLKHIN